MTLFLIGLGAIAALLGIFDLCVGCGVGDWFC
nr:MAG TPA: protein of unknown function (DUF4395) [Caudoviricetes sp.]